MITGAQHPTPLLVGRATPASGAGAPASALRYASARLPWKRAHASVFDSSIMEEPYHVRLVFDYMIRKADSSGFCLGIETSLARIFNVTLEDFLQAIKILEAPDSKSRTPDNEGKRIRKVQGGWLILNHGIYQSESKIENKTDSESESESKNRVSDANRVSKTEDKVSDKVSDLPAFDLSHEELLVSYGLTGRIESLFFILRDWAIRAALDKSWKFPVSRDFLAKKLDCLGSNVTRMLQELVALGAIRKVEEHNYREGRSAMYRWALPTTIPIPSEPESDPDEEPLF
jgi:hypothetical protein